MKFMTHVVAAKQNIDINNFDNRMKTGKENKRQKCYIKII